MSQQWQLISITLLQYCQLQNSRNWYEPKGASFTLATNKPWDTLKAQLLPKIDGVLQPNNISFADYQIKYYIPSVLLKPSLDLESEEDYEGLVDCFRNIKSNSPMINVNIWPVTGGSGRDNDKENEEENSSAKTKKVHVTSLPIIATADF